MPAARTAKINCASLPAPTKTRKPNTKTASVAKFFGEDAFEKEERERDEKDKKELAKIVHTLKKDWNASLEPWTVDNAFRFRLGTIAMFKSDGEPHILLPTRQKPTTLHCPAAKKTYSLTEKEILTLQHESIPNSAKTFFSHEDVKALAQRKCVRLGQAYDESASFGAVLLEKTNNDNRSRKNNFSVYVPPLGSKPKPAELLAWMGAINARAERSQRSYFRRGRY